MKKLLLSSMIALSMAFTIGQAQAKSLVFCSEASPEGWTPAFYTGGQTIDAAGRTIYSRLVEFEPGKTNIIPGLAEKWDISADGKAYTFHLRKGVKFHSNEEFKPSRDFNADDVIFSFMRQKDDKHPFHKVSNGSYDYFSDMGLTDLITSIDRVDDYTVRFNLSGVEAPFLADLAMDFASIASAEYADKMMKAGKPEIIDQKPIGTGPFMLVNYQKDAVIRYKANPDFYRGKSKIDDLIFAITPDAAVRLQKLRANECQIMVYPNPADLAMIEKDPKINLLSKEGLNVGYLAYNALKEPFNKVEVRKALNMAINKQAIIDAVYLKAGKVAKNPIPPTMWSYNDAVVDDSYDPKKAAEMLKAAGVSGLKMKLWAMPVQRPYNPNARRMAELIQADWKAVGVDAEIVSFEWTEYLKKSKDKDRDGAVLLGWTGDNGDPDNFLNVLLGCDGVGGNNRAQWCSPKFDELIKKAKATTDVTTRTNLYKEAQVVFKQEAPWATIAHSVVYEPISKNVSGYAVSAFGYHEFYGVDVK